MSQAKPCIEYDPACVECRRDAGKDAAGTTWQCVGHVCLERDALRELMNVYNIGGWTDALVPVQRALKAEAERDAALAERDALRQDLVIASSNHIDAMNALELEKTCRDRNWNDLKWVRKALDNECRYSEQLKTALTEARRVLRLCEWDTNSLCLVCRLSDNDGHAPDCALAAVLAQEEK